MSPPTPAAGQSLTFAICPGLFGGVAHTRGLIRLLTKAGYRSAATLEQADIVIAHSAGCWLIPPNVKPKLVVYIGMPLAQTNPWKSWFAANANQFRGGALYDLAVLLKDVYYALLQPKRNLQIIRMAKHAESIIIPGAHAIFIANQHDPWPRGSALQTYVDTKSWAFISLPGSHDDIWQHPARYATIIDRYARLLAQTGKQ